MKLVLSHVNMDDLAENVHRVLSPIANLNTNDGEAALLAAYLMVAFPRVVEPDVLKRLMQSCSLACGQIMEKELLGVGTPPSRES